MGTRCYHGLLRTKAKLIVQMYLNHAIFKSLGVEFDICPQITNLGEQSVLTFNVKVKFVVQMDL